MLPVGLAVLIGGYTLAYFGWDSLQGPGVGLLDLVIPGRYGAGPVKVSAGEQAPAPVVPPIVAGSPFIPPQGPVGGVGGLYNLG